MPITRRPGESLDAFKRRKARIADKHQKPGTGAEQRADIKARKTAIKTGKHISVPPKSRKPDIKFLQKAIQQAQGPGGEDNNTSLDLKAKLRKLKKK